MMKHHQNLLKIAVILVFLLGMTDVGYAWREGTHKWDLTWDALDLVEQHSDQLKAKGEYEYDSEIWDYNSSMQYIVQGAWDEDFPCELLGNDLRAYNHYRHAISGHNLTDAPWVGIGDTHVDALTWAKTNRDLGPEEFRDGEFWDGFKKGGWTASDVDNGNMCWQQAINRYGYTNSSKKLAYYTLGFILHLLQDMGCPEHVHDDPHGASGYTGFEMWVDKNYREKFEQPINLLQPKKFTTLDKYFINLSYLGYSVNRFHGGELSTSEPYIGSDTDLAKMFDIDYSWLESEWVLKNHNGVDMINSSINLDFEWDEDDYRKSPIWTKGHDEGEWWPTSVEMDGVAGNPRDDEGGYYYIELSGNIPTDGQREIYPAAFLPTPLSNVSDQCLGGEYVWTNWTDSDTKGRHIYDLIGERILPHVIEYSAGLIEFYYDIVNHPPYVNCVEVYQGDECKYRRYWWDNEELLPGKDTIKYVGARSLLCSEKEIGEVGPGEIAINITFSEPVKVEKVELGNEVITGSLNEDETVWTGKYTIPDDGSMDGFRAISIDAKDKNRHYENTGDDFGLPLDKNPATPARRFYEPEPERYWWKDYEQGIDTNHGLLIISEDECPECPIPAGAILVTTVSGLYEYYWDASIDTVVGPRRLWYDKEKRQLWSLECFDSEGEEHGTWIEWDDNGHKSMEWHYEHGELVTRTFYYENGQKSEEKNYLNGAGTYRLTYWYPNGQKDSVQYWQDYKETGMWICWDETGTKLYEGTFEDGEKITGIEYCLDGSINIIWEYGPEFPGGVNCTYFRDCP